MKVFLILYMYIISNPYNNEYLIKIDTPPKYEILNLLQLVVFQMIS